MIGSRRALLLAALLTACAGLPAASAQGTGPVPAGSRQLVLVLTAGWDATAGTLQRFERSETAAAWTPTDAPVPVVVGRSGLGWGRGLHPAPPGGPVKREGDGRATAGVFRLSALFGYAPAEAMGPLQMPYLHAHPGLECVDDPASRHYNRIVDRDSVGRPDWTSHEEMRRRDDLYRLGVVVDHNAAPPRPGAGSCIFLHLWSGPADPTVGCTAMAPAEAEALVRWLDAGRTPVLVQLPRPAYQRLRTAWGLP
jgi:L,D-peptidoglycan transpeptidase YkuD (ErfK/YbiS/YcfS/YnhG family)